MGLAVWIHRGWVFDIWPQATRGGAYGVWLKFNGVPVLCFGFVLAGVAGGSAQCCAYLCKIANSETFFPAKITTVSPGEIQENSTQSRNIQDFSQGRNSMIGKLGTAFIEYLF